MIPSASYPDILLDITMTACRRPEILKRTLNSFCRNMLRPHADRCRLIINVDPVGEDIRPHDLIPIISAYFKYFIARFPMTPSFPEAFKWTWEQISAPWILHLEDDWELLVPTNLSEMIQCLQNNPRLALLRFPHKPCNVDTTKQWNLFFPYNGQYYECPMQYKKAAGFAGHPSVIRRDFIIHTRNYLNTIHNPEKQFHGPDPEMISAVLSWEYGVWGHPGDPTYIKDIGTEWRESHGFTKGKNKAFFTQWEKK